MKLSDIKKVHFIGIGGIGMSALARLCHHEGKVVTGTNGSLSPETLDALREMGVSISLDTSVLPEVDLYVYSEAWHNLNPTLLKKAFDSGIPTINYFDALGMVANEYYLIAVAGSHGKTTTTAMLIDIFEAAGFDPSGVVGSLRATTKSNYRAGKSKYFIVEACEYRRDFLSLTPDVLIITNVEHEHVDYYKNLGEVQQAFREFACQVREGGVVIVNFGGENIAPILESVTVSVRDYGKYFDPLLKLKVPGVHNQMNAAAAIAAAEYLGIPKEVSKTALENFAGTWRRFEYKGEINGAKVYDDYGHHPTEIAATIRGTKDMYPDKKITLVFQSHTYSRTHELFADFVSALGLADEVYILPIYAAREENESGVSHAMLADAVEAQGISAQAFDSFDEVVTKIKTTVSENDVVLVMGAGDITRIADILTKS
jgi:UDP-N-acetylmuramate--alanine ligase